MHNLDLLHHILQSYRDFPASSESLRSRITAFDYVTKQSRVYHEIASVLGRGDGNQVVDKLELTVVITLYFPSSKTNDVTSTVGTCRSPPSSTTFNVLCLASILRQSGIDKPDMDWTENCCLSCMDRKKLY